MPMTVRQVRAALILAGWLKVSQRGSHEKWRSPDGRRTAIVFGKDSGTMPAGTLASIRRQTGLDYLR
jgi:predicted RNA binding protein YcfA (HicA-like mRNA interferase family)